MIRKLYILIRNFLTTMRQNNTSSFAGGAAFFVFLSIIPIAILICCILPYTSITREFLDTVTVYLIPGRVAAFLSDIIQEYEGSSVAVISITVIVALWSGGKGLFALINGLNAVNKVDERRNWVILRARASVMTLFMLSIMLFSLVVLVFGNLINELLTTIIPDFHILLKLLLHFRFLFVWAFFTFFFQLLYTLLPAKHMIFKEQFPGALFASVGWSVFSWGFSLYLEYFNAFSFYGSLTTIIIGMIWLYFCMYILLTGAQINIYFQPIFKVIADNRKKLHIEKKNRKSKRRALSKAKKQKVG